MLPRYVLIAGLTLLGLGIAAVLTGSPLTIARTSTTQPGSSYLATVVKGGRICQSGEALARDTTALGLSLGATAGPRLTASAFSNGRVLARGSLAPAWSGRTTTVPVTDVSRASPVTLCVTLGPTNRPVAINGEATGKARAATFNGEALPGRLIVVDLRRSDTSWWSLVVPTAEHLGLGGLGIGDWTAALVVLLLVIAVASASWLLAGDAP